LRIGAAAVERFRLAPRDANLEQEEFMGNISRPRPTRILVASRDPNFERVVSFLLHRHGFDVKTAHPEAPLYESVDRYDARVVIVDAQNLPVHTARLAMLGLGLVLVDEEPRLLKDRRVLPKWGPFENILAEVERQVARTETVRADPAGDASAEPWRLRNMAAAAGDMAPRAR
jgi:hypothetical protein